MKHIDYSPIDNAPLEPFISCLDHSISKEKFSILIDQKSQLLVTSPRPKDADLAKYYDSEAYISHSDASVSFIDKLYMLVRSISLKRKLKLINSFKTDGRSILDIGAGTGEFLSVCKKAGWQVAGIEPNLKARSKAEKKLLTKLDKSLDDLNGNSFDIISMWHVLEHMPNLNQTLDKVQSLLKPEGVLIIAVPNFKSFDAAYYKNYWAAYDLPRHLWHFSKSSMIKLTEKSNLNLVKILPLKFDAYYVSLLSEKYKKSRFGYIRAFFIGLMSNLKAMGTKEYSSLIYIIKKA